jgi:small-conductance mechanosensitive channel
MRDLLNTHNILKFCFKWNEIKQRIRIPETITYWVFESVNEFCFRQPTKQITVMLEICLRIRLQSVTVLSWLLVLLIISKTLPTDCFGRLICFVLTRVFSTFMSRKYRNTIYLTTCIILYSDLNRIQEKSRKYGLTINSLKVWHYSNIWVQF